MAPSSDLPPPSLSLSHPSIELRAPPINLIELNLNSTTTTAVHCCCQSRKLELDLHHQAPPTIKLTIPVDSGNYLPLSQCITPSFFLYFSLLGCSPFSSFPTVPKVSFSPRVLERCGRKICFACQMSRALALLVHSLSWRVS